MSELGSIFDGAPNAGAGAKGPDVRVQAQVPRSWLGSPDGLEISVPDKVPYEGGTVPRRLGPGEPAGKITLHLASDLGERTTLRLRGQGGEHPESGLPGDLLVQVTIVAEESAGLGLVVPVVVIAAVAAAAAWWSYGIWWG